MGTNDASTPLVDTGRLSLYKDTLSVCEHLLCVCVGPEVVDWDLPATYTYEQDMDMSLWTWIDQKCREHFVDKGDIAVTAANGKALSRGLGDREQSLFPVTVVYRENKEKKINKRIASEVSSH